jgi:hypothetical protein
VSERGGSIQFRPASLARARTSGGLFVGRLQGFRDARNTRAVDTQTQARALPVMEGAEAVE